MRMLRFATAPIVVAGGAALVIGFWPTISERLIHEAEQRLEAQTRLAWTIGSIGLDAGPSLVLRDVVAREAGARAPLLSIREAHFSAALSMLVGDEGAWSASLVGVAANIPIDAALSDPLTPTAATPIAPVGRLASVEAVAKGVEFDDAGTDRVAARAQGLELSGRLASHADKVDVALALETRTHLASIAFGWPSADADAKLVVAPREAGGERVDATTKLRFDARKIKFEAVRGTIGAAPFSADASLDFSGEPSFAADIRLRRLIVTDDEAGSAPSLRAAPEARADAHVIEASEFELIDPRVFDKLRVTATIGLDELRIGRVKLGGVTARFSGAERLVDLSFDAKSFYEGAVRGRYTLAPQGETGLLHQISLSLGGTRLSPFLADAAGAGMLAGTATARLELQTTGAHADETLRKAVGRAEISIVDGRVSGAGLSKAVDIPLASDLLGALGDGSLTSFRRFGGSFQIKDGAAASSDLRFESKLAEADGAGRADLAGGLIDFTFKARLALGARGKRLEAPVRIHGPWADPSVDADLSGTFAARAIDKLGEVGNSLFGGKDNGSIGDALDSLFSGGARDGKLGRKGSGR